LFLGGGFLDLIKNQLTADLLGTFDDDEYQFKNPFSWDITGKNLVFMAAEAFIFFILNLFWEMIIENRNPVLEEDLNLLTLKNVSKRYHTLGTRFTAVHGIDLTISKGECFALIGLNGAGKSTTFQMIVGKIRKTAGTILQSSPQIGYCPQSNSLDMKISVRNILKVYATIAGFSRSKSEIIADYLIKHLTYKLITTFTVAISVEATRGKYVQQYQTLDTQT